jgi:hypothetical protein
LFTDISYWFEGCMGYVVQELLIDKAAASADLQQHVGSLRYLHSLEEEYVTRGAAGISAGPHQGKLVAG